MSESHKGKPGKPWTEERKSMMRELMKVKAKEIWQRRKAIEIAE